MFITRHAFDSLNTERIKATEEARTLAHQNAALQITCDWFRANAEKWERERAHLLWQYLGLKVEVPVVTKAEPPEDEILGGSSLFQDVGDKKAKELGLELYESVKQ